MKEKYLEYFMDSRIYSKQDVLNSIEETKKDFETKDVKVNIFLNRFGIYEVIFEFKDKNTYINKMKSWVQENRIKIKSNDMKIVKQSDRLQERVKKEIKEKERLHRYSGNRYGMYKETRNVYKPL